MAEIIKQYNEFPLCQFWVKLSSFLGAVTTSKRFNLSVQFLSSFDRSAGSQLVEKLLTSLHGRQQDLAELGVTEFVIHSIADKLNVSTKYTVNGPVCK